MPDFVLLVVHELAPVSVDVTFSGCTMRGMYNGQRYARITPGMLGKMMRALHVEYALSAPL